MKLFTNKYILYKKSKIDNSQVPRDHEDKNIISHFDFMYVPLMLNCKCEAVECFWSCEGLKIKSVVGLE